MLYLTIIFLCISLTKAGFLLDILLSPNYTSCLWKCDMDLGCSRVIFEISENSNNVMCSFLFRNTDIPDCTGSDPWTEPANWTVGQPDLFLQFEHPACLTFEHENAQLFASMNGLGLHFNKDLPMGTSRFVSLDPDIIPICLINPDNCNPGFTVSFWIRISSGCRSESGILSSRTYEAGGSQGIWLMCFLDNTLRFYVYGSSQHVHEISSVSYQEYIWFKYTATFANTWQLSVYFDGQSVGSQSGNANSNTKLPNDGVFIIGKKWTNRDYLYGPFQMDSFFVIEQVLSEDLIQLI